MTAQGKGRRLRFGVTILLAAVITGACSQTAAVFDAETVPEPSPELIVGKFTNASQSLPINRLKGKCMDAASGDVDADGDLDLVLAQENGTNLVLINDGDALFSLGSLQGGDGDNEDVRLADLDGDEDLDLVTVHEDDRKHSIFHNDGTGAFVEVESRLPAELRSTANALELYDLDRDGLFDLLIGNAGTNLVLRHQTDGSFLDETSTSPIGDGITQDLLLLDVDNDGDDDLFVANEESNLLLVNDGDGIFTDETDSRLPASSSESREADAADIDNDGDLDIVVANVQFNRDVPATNQLLRNDGNGVFSDVTGSGLGSLENSESSFTIRFVDIDNDGDQDILSPANQLGDGGSVEVWSNQGDGAFEQPLVSPFADEPSGSTFDIEVADFNRDGLADLYFCNRSGSDQLYLGG